MESCPFRQDVCPAISPCLSCCACQTTRIGYRYPALPDDRLNTNGAGIPIPRIPVTVRQERI